MLCVKLCVDLFYIFYSRFRFYLGVFINIHEYKCTRSNLIKVVSFRYKQQAVTLLF